MREILLGLNNAYARVKNGWLHGERLASGVKVFRGIPYAAPPIGELRWRPPIPPIEWMGVRQAVYFGFEPVQDDAADCKGISQDKYEHLLTLALPRSEDCLYLNVWTPAETSRDKLPVFIWIHGGSLQSGAGSCFLYNSAVLAEKNIVVVTINYRLGVFGFFAHPELTGESKYNSSGNYGLLDQLMAMQWVRENIAEFGGDPDRITIGGQSAGALSVGAIVASSLARGLFRGATIQSGPPFGLTHFYIQLEQAEAEGRRFMKLLGSKKLADMRAIPPWELLQKSRENNFIPRITIDGWLLPNYPGYIIRAGKHNHVALLLGGTANEFSDAYSVEDGMPIEEYRKKLRNQFGAHEHKLLELYPANDTISAARSAIKLNADIMLSGARLTAKLANNHGDDVYLYYFTRVLPMLNSGFYGANHSAELPFLFHLVDKGALFPWDNRTWEEMDYQYSGIMMSFWANFIKNGDPNSGNLPNWPKYNPADDRLMEFGNTIAVAAMPRPENLTILESLF